MNRELLDKYFNFQMPTAMLKAVYNTNGKKKSNDLINVIKSGLRDLKDETKEMSKYEVKIEKTYKIVDTVEKILDFDRQDQEGKGLKILTTDQMIKRLPISLAQVKTGNNSEKFKNEIRQLLYSFYR